MLWYFLMGMVGGAVGMVMLAGWWMKSHIRKVTLEEFENEVRRMDRDGGSERDR